MLVEQNRPTYYAYFPIEGTLRRNLFESEMAGTFENGTHLSNVSVITVVSEPSHATLDSNNRTEFNKDPSPRQIYNSNIISNLNDLYFTYYKHIRSEI